jgi:hypothetical protein
MKLIDKKISRQDIAEILLLCKHSLPNILLPETCANISFPLSFFQKHVQIFPSRLCSYLVFKEMFTHVSGRRIFRRK